jgi:hypothetical protein
VRYDPARPESSALSCGVRRSIRMQFAFSLVWLGFVTGIALLIWMDRGGRDDVLLRSLLAR